jgi:hypothetical protein
MQNNSPSLATTVETFYIAETIDLVHDNDALQEWNEKVQELGLTGQADVIVKDKSPVPFLWMNEALISTFETLCPTKVSIDKYSKTPIPLELLKTVSLCRNEQYFDKIEVWYNEKEKDPVIVGYKYDQTQTRKDEWYQLHYAAKYLIGRWADVKASLDQLTERAKKIFIASETNSLTQNIRQYQRQLEDVALTAESKFGNAMPLTSLPF